MALPVAHSALALGLARSRDPKLLGLLALLAIAPDFDFLLVWGFGFPVQDYHRTFSHSILLYGLLALAWSWWRPPGTAKLSPSLLFSVLCTHSLLDLLCTADAADHGVMLFWPLAEARFGWPVLVPLYRLFGTSPFSLPGALAFTVLELGLAVPLWFSSRMLCRFGFSNAGEDC